MEIKLMWIDDEWKGGEAWMLTQYRDFLKQHLARKSIKVNIVTKDPETFLSGFFNQDFDLLIVDFNLNDRGNIGNGFTLVDRLYEKLKNVPPAVCFTQHLAEPDFLIANRVAESRILGFFEKSAAGISQLGDFIEKLIQRPPMTLLILSDVHSGFFEKAEIDESFFDLFLEDIKQQTKLSNIDYLVVTGDFAWKHQEKDLIGARNTIAKILQGIGAKDYRSFHFCPGNHDLSYDKPDEPFEFYRHFVTGLASWDEGYQRRFCSFNPKLGSLGKFGSRSASLAVERGKVDSVLFAALNSCRVDINDGKMSVVREVGEEQWATLEKLLANEAPGQFRIALLHHPIFAAPGGDDSDEQPILDQASALQRLFRLKFDLVVHGHAHFSAMYEHRAFTLNGVDRDNLVQRINIVACPTLGAEPSQTTPSRQYLILHIGANDGGQEGRNLTLRSRVFNRGNKSWTEGQQIPSGVFTSPAK